jgi:2-phosphoglycerate kinase
MTEDSSWLGNLYLIGGSPCSGKTTITNQIAETYGFSTYRCDDAYFEHAKELTTEQPVFSRLVNTSSEAIWMRPVPQQIEEELAIYREEFPFIVRDLRYLAQSGPVIAEGAALLPSLVATLGIASHRAIWIVPTEEFQRYHYGQRDWRHDVVKDCSNPERAWENWMARDAGFARRVAAEARDHAFALITTDGSASIETNLAIVERHFGLWNRSSFSRH